MWSHILCLCLPEKWPVVAVLIMAKGHYDPEIFLSTCQSVLEKNTDHQPVLNQQASA